MRLRLIAVGTRMPEWVDAAFTDYARRLRGSWRVELIELSVAPRGSSSGVAADAARATEARRILATLSARDYLVALDERGHEPGTLELAHWFDERRTAGQDLAFVIGGPDGLAQEVLARAQHRWSLSRLTLPHGLARVLLIEQLYRCSTVLVGHPYHRE